MKRSFALWTIIALAALLAADSVASADLAPFGGGRPRPRPRPPVSEPAPPQPGVDATIPLSFREDADTAVSKLIIPKRYLEASGWRKTAGGPHADGAVVQVGDHWPMLLAGVAMSLAAASVVLLRKQGRAVRITTLAIALGAGALATTQMITAAEPRDKVDAQRASNRRVVIEIVDEGNAVQFVRGTK